MRWRTARWRMKDVENRDVPVPQSSILSKKIWPIGMDVVSACVRRQRHLAPWLLTLLVHA
jgi:hypothetical protein